ncbi:hypothetical protein [Streptomyces pratensis]|uniref:hypothetical protein n=1 Tax=Streptomyces pratensis TaxID=1169025 RepID=UPI003015FEA8
MKNMKHAVMRSYADWTSYDGIPRDEFALDPKAAAETSLYEADFVPGDRLHDRTRLARTTRQDAPLLTRAANDGHEQLTPIFDWFRNNLWDVTPETERTQREDYTAVNLLRNEDFRPRAEELLRVADLGIAEVEVEQTSSGRPVVRLVHAGGGEHTALDWSAESWGTRSWFALIGPLLLALDSGAVLSYLAGSFGAVPNVSEGQIGRRLVRTDDMADMEAGEV